MQLALPKGRPMQPMVDLCAQAGLTFKYAATRDLNPQLCWSEKALAVRDEFCREKGWDPRELAPVFPGLTKARDIPQQLGLGIVDAGFIGWDFFEESHGKDEIAPLINLGTCRVPLVVAAAGGNEDILVNPPKRPLVIATEYENIANEWARTFYQQHPEKLPEGLRNLEGEVQPELARIILHVNGGTEGYLNARRGRRAKADLIVDCRETGQTMIDNNCVVVDTLFESATWFMANKAVMSEAGPEARAIAVLQHLFEQALMLRGGNP